MSKKILITAPFVASFKNVIYNEGFINSLSQEYEIFVLSGLPMEQIANLVPQTILKKIKIIEYSFPKASFRQSLTAFRSVYAFNKAFPSSTSQIKEKAYSLTPSLRLFVGALNCLAFFVGWKKIYLSAEKAKYKLYRDKEFSLLVKQINPDLIFCLAISFEPDFFVIAEALSTGRKMIGMVHSWDNLSAKGPICQNFQKVIVWNSFQKEELIRYYPKAKFKIAVAGMPQLDHLFAGISKTDAKRFKKSQHIPEDCRLLTYTTGTPSTIPNENLVIEEIYNELKKLNFKWHLRVRIHPKNNMANFRALANKKNVSLEKVNQNDFRARDGQCFTSEGIDHYTALLKSSDVVLNIASTVSLEALAVGTPVIHIAIDDKKTSYYSSNKRFYDYDHIRHLSQFGAIPIVDKKRVLNKTIEQVLKNDYKKRERAMLVSDMVGRFDGANGARLSKEITR